MAAGLVTCWRCGKRILPGQLWDLGHVDGSSTRYAGPEHALKKDCPAGGNRSAGGKARHAIGRPSRQWVPA